MKKKFLIIGFIMIIIFISLIPKNGEIEEIEMTNRVYNYTYLRGIDGDIYPENMHLCIEKDDYLYFVDKYDNMKIKRVDTLTGTVVTIVTETELITVFYHDKDTDRLYYAYGSSGSVSYVDLTDTTDPYSITDLTVEAALINIKDLFIYDSELFAIDTNEDDLTYYKYSNDVWGDVGTISIGNTPYYDIDALSAGANTGAVGIAYYDDDFYVVDIDNHVYKYPHDFSALSTTYDISAQFGGRTASRIEYFNGEFYIGESGDNTMRVYSSVFVYQRSFELNNGCKGITTDGIYLYTLSYNVGYTVDVEVWDSEDNLITTVEITRNGYNSHGIFYNGSNFYGFSAHPGNVFIEKYDSDFNKISSVEIFGYWGGGSYGITFDGAYTYFSHLLDDKVYMSNLNLKDGSNTSYSVIVGDYVYTIYKYPKESTGDIYRKLLTDASNPASIETLPANTKIPQYQRGVAEDRSILYFILEDYTDFENIKKYLYTYNIDTDTLTKSNELDLYLMLNRNTESPLLEKGFTKTDSLIYEIDRGQTFKIADIGATYVFGTSPPTPTTIATITDSFVIDENGEMWEWTDQINNYKDIEISYTQNNVAMALLSTKALLPNGQTVSIYDSDNGLLFKGQIKEKFYDGNYREYKCVSVNKELINNTFSGTYTAKTTIEIMEDLIDENANFIKYDAVSGTVIPSIDPNGSFTETYTIVFSNKIFAEAFDMLMDLEDGIWWCEPDGTIHAVAVGDKVFGGAYIVPETSQTLGRFGIDADCSYDFWDDVYRDILYEATYNFEDEINETGTDINFVDSATLHDGEVDIIDNYLNHYAVLRLLDDATPIEDPYILHNITQTTSGIIEYWIATSDDNQVWSIRLMEDATIVSRNRIYLQYSWRDSGGVWRDLYNIVNNEWIHIKIEWRADNTHDIYINGSKLVDNQALRNNQVVGVNGFSLSAYGDSVEYLYFDAFGLVGTDGYEEGDNRYPPLGLIPYLATYNFRTQHGLEDTAIDFVDAVDLDDGECIIVSTLGNHTNVLRLQDDAAAAEDPNITHSIAQTTSGICEFWLGTNNAGELWRFSLFEGATAILQFRIYNDNFEWRNSVSVWASFITAADNTWYHIKIQWYADNTFDIIINETLELDGETNHNNQTLGINIFDLLCQGDSVEYLYFDAFGLVGTDGYEEGDNLNPLEWNLENGEDCSISLIRTLNSHNNVIELSDTTATDGLTFSQTFTDGVQTEGIVEFWFNSDSINAGSLQLFKLMSDDVIAVSLAYYDGDLQYYDGAWNIIIALELNTWYHIRIDFDCVTDTFDLYVDGSKELTGADFRNVVAGISSLTFDMGNAGIGKFYIDTIDYSWRTGYTEGDNIYEHNVNKNDGIFKATYNFEDETVDGTTITDWTKDEGGGTIDVKAFHDNHKKVVELYDSAGGDNVVFTNTLSDDQEYGDVEFYWLIDNASDSIQILLYHGAVRVVYFYIESDQFRYYDGAASHNIGLVPNDGIWYHIRISFECTANAYNNLAQYTFKVYVDDVEYGDYDFENNQAHIDKVVFQTANAATGYAYVDAIAYSWSRDYLIGDNYPYFETEDLITKTEISKSTKQIRSVPRLKEIQQQINKIHIYGGIVNGARLESTANDLSSQQLNGIIEFIDHFPHIRNQADLDTLATAILNRTGIGDNPIYIYVDLYLLGFRQCGKYLYFSFDPYDELEDVDDYFILELIYDAKDNIGSYVLCSGLIQEGREYLVNMKKTSKADEEQIDILAGLI